MTANLIISTLLLLSATSFAQQTQQGADQQQLQLQLVQGGKDATPPPVIVVPSRTLRLQDHPRQHRELPSVIFAPVEGSRVLTKTAFINANSKETGDEAFKIYEHFLATKGQSVLAQVADPFFVTQPPERTTIATVSDDERRPTRTHPFDNVHIVTTTTVPSFTMATVSIQEAAVPSSRNDTHALRQFVQGRGVRREEPRFPSEARPVVRPRMIASPSVLHHQPSSLNAPPVEQGITAPTAQPLGAPRPAAQSSPFQFASAASQQHAQQLQLQPPPQQQQQQQQPQQQFHLGPPLVGFPQAVQSPFRAQFPDQQQPQQQQQQQFVPDLRNPDEVAWANYLAAKYNERQQQQQQQRASGGQQQQPRPGSFVRNRQIVGGGAPIPLPSPARIEMMQSDAETFAPQPASPFDLDEEQKRSIPQTAFVIDETGENFEKPSNRLRNYFARFPHDPRQLQQQQQWSQLQQQQQQQLLLQQQQPNFPQIAQPFSPHQQQQQFFLNPQQQQQQQLLQLQQAQFRQLQQQQQQQLFGNSFVDRSNQERQQQQQRFGGERTTLQPSTQQLQQQQFTTPSPFFPPPTTNAFYNGPGQPFGQPNLRREIAPAPTLLSPAQQQGLQPFGFGAATTTSPPTQFQRPPTPAQPPPFTLPNPLDLLAPPPLQPAQPQPAFTASLTPAPIVDSRPRSALSPNQKLDSCCRKQGVNPVCQNLCNFDSFNDKTLVGAFITGQCPGDQLGKAFDCASTKADHNECCVRGGLGSFLGGKCLPFCNTHRDTPANVLDYIPCLQVFRVIRDCYQDYQRVNPNIFGD